MTVLSGKNTQKDTIITCNDDKPSNDYVMRENTLSICNDSNKQLVKSDWWYLVQTLESWNVFKPRAIIKKYGALNCWEAMLRTKENYPKCKGAYFTKVVRSLVAAA